jgi:membrane protein involved in colicin uptake
MEARYGRTRRSRADRRLAIVIGGFLAFALVGFIIWAAFGKPATITGTLTNSSFSNGVMTVSIAVDNQTGKAGVCLVSATNDNQSSVGSRQVEVTANQTQVESLQIVAVEPATGAVVDSCWIK